MKPKLTNDKLEKALKAKPRSPKSVKALSLVAERAIERAKEANRLENEISRLRMLMRDSLGIIDRLSENLARADRKWKIDNEGFKRALDEIAYEAFKQE